MHSRYLVFIALFVSFLSGCRTGGSSRISGDAPAITPQVMAIPTVDIPPAETAGVETGSTSEAEPVAVSEGILPREQPEYIEGTGYTEDMFVVQGELGEHYEVAVESALYGLDPDRWYHHFSREHFIFGEGEVVRLRSGELMPPLYPSELESELPIALRTHHYEAVAFYIVGRDNTNPLDIEVDDAGNLVEMRPVEQVGHIDPSRGGGTYVKRPVLQQLFHDPCGDNGVNVLLVFRVTNAEAADRALGYLAGTNWRGGPERVPAHLAGDPEQAPIPAGSWYLGIGYYDFATIILLSPEDGGQPTLRATHRSSESMRAWEVSIMSKSLHNRACTETNCHPQDGEPEVDGDNGCYIKCAIRHRYNFEVGDWTPADFGRFTPNGARLQTEGME